MSNKSGLVAVIGDEDTVTGFLLAGIGHRDKDNKVNFLVVDPEKTPGDVVVAAFHDFTTRKDISIILITQTVAQTIRHLISGYDKTIPTILEIPSKAQQYDETKDPIVMRVLRLMGKAD